MRRKSKYLKQDGWEEGLFDGWIPCYWKYDGFLGVEMVGKNILFDILIFIITPIASLNPRGFKIKIKKK